MGNDLILQLETQHRKTNRFWKSKRNKVDDFIIEFSQSYCSKQNQMIDMKSFDQKRVVFVSLIGVFQTYQNCPSHVLYTSIFILPLKKDWIYNLPKYIDKDEYLTEFKQLSVFNSDTETLKFIKLLQWKDSQGLLFCMLDEHKTDETSLIHPFWTHFCNKLSKMHDTITRRKYNTIELDDIWWEKHYKHSHQSKFGSRTACILSELYFLTMKFKTIKEIIYQSNPDSLRPVTFYGENSERFKCVGTAFLLSDHNYKPIDIVHKDASHGEWHISIDYET